MPVKREQLRRDLEAAGVEPGDVLVVHSSLGSVGWVIGGPEEFIQALLDVLGHRGTLLMPSFSFNLVAWNLPPFDPTRTPSRVGYLTDVFWRMKRCVRSFHPTHSMAALGPAARDLIEGPLDYAPLGVGSPLDRVREAGGKILLVGVGQNRNSTVHLAESLAEMPYLRVPFSEATPYDLAQYLERPNGPAIDLRIYEMPGSSEGFDVLEDRLRSSGVVGDVMIGNAPSQIMASRELCDAVTGMLARDPLLFLRGPDASEISVRRRRHVESLIPRGTGAAT